MRKPLASRVLDRMHGVDSAVREDPRVKPFIKNAIRLASDRVRDPRGILRDLVRNRDLVERLSSAVSNKKAIRGMLHTLLVRHPESAVDAYSAVLEHDFRRTHHVSLSEAESSREEKLASAAALTRERLSLVRTQLVDAVKGYTHAFSGGGIAPTPYALIEETRPELHLLPGKGGFAYEDKLNVKELCEAANRQGVDPNVLLDHFSEIPPRMLLELDMDPAGRVHPALDVLLFREPDPVFPGFLPYAHRILETARRENPGLLKEFGVTDTRKKAEEIAEKAERATLNYYKRHELPVDRAKGGEAIAPPLFRRLSFWWNGLPMNFASNSFVNNFFRILKEKHQRPLLSDRQNILMELKPRPRGLFPFFGFTDLRSFGRVISRENLELPLDPEVDREPEDRYGTFFDRVTPDAYGLDVHYLMLSDPSVVKRAHRALYTVYMRRRWDYHVEGLVDRFTTGRYQLQKKRDLEIDAACDEADQNIDWYREHFLEARRIRLSKSGRNS